MSSHFLKRVPDLWKEVSSIPLKMPFVTASCNELRDAEHPTRSIRWAGRSQATIALNISMCMCMYVLLLATAGATVPASTTQKLTVYRITPRNYSGVTNMDTGDSGGDVFFGLYELSFPLLCSDPHFRQGIGCINAPILSIPGFNVYTKNVIEADSRFGDYSQCNPDPASGIFYCAHFHHSACWTDIPKYKSAFSGVCDPNVCKCKAIETLALGHQSIRGSFSPPKNGTIPPSCAANHSATSGLMPLDGQQLKGLPYATEHNVTVGDCCTKCSAEHFRKWFPCRGYSFVPGDGSTATGTCARYNIVWGIQRAKGTRTAFFSGGDSGNAAIQRVLHSLGHLSNLLGGSWFSTQAPGECTGNSTLGSDCWWRLQSVERIVNSTCVNNRLIQRVIKARPGCFSACPEPQNRSSACWIGCLFETIVGNQSSSPPVPSMHRNDLVDAFESSFDDEAAGGCPVVPPCPPPCKPPLLSAEATNSRVALRPAWGPWM